VIAPRNLITQDDIKAVIQFLELGSPLSGYLAGNPWGGAAVQRLEEMWCTKFNRRHAICCNSATSGLLAACVAVGVKSGMTVGVPALSMSATAAVPAFCGASLQFLDSDLSGDISYEAAMDRNPMEFVIGTTLWGYPLDYSWQSLNVPFILDNAQGILSNYGDGTWSENIAHICVTSFNVHKQVNAGEMGIISCDDDRLARDMRIFINHGENANVGHRYPGIGLNLRPTEISAVLALSQMARIDQTIGNLNWLARQLTDALPPQFEPFYQKYNSARYCYTFQVDPEKRDAIVKSLLADGVPCSAMYKPLYHLPAFYDQTRPGWNCEIAEQISATTIVFELCAWRYEDDLINIGYALKKAAAP